MREKCKWRAIIETDNVEELADILGCSVQSIYVKKHNPDDVRLKGITFRRLVKRYEYYLNDKFQFEANTLHEVNDAIGHDYKWMKKNLVNNTVGKEHIRVVEEWI